MFEPERAPIDHTAIDALLEATGGDPAFLAELIDLFSEDGAGQLATLEAAVQAGPAHAEEARRAAHSLKSNAANFGATELADLCRRIETQAHAGEFAGIAPLLDKARAEFARVQAALSAIRQGA